jgi:hypothetical protein
METLDDIACLHPDSPAVTSRLRAIVQPALCVRYHQNQGETVLMQWQRKLQQLKPQKGERRAAKSVQRSKKQEFIHDGSIEDAQEQLREMRELLAKLQQELGSERHHDREYERREEQVTKDKQEEERNRRRREKRDREARRHEKERLEKERLEKERLDKEKKEREQKRRREREQAAYNERIRQRAEKRQEKHEREKREKEQKERDEWDQLWIKYQEQWVHFRDSGSGERGLRNAIPWPVKSGSYRDVTDSNVKEFLQKAVPRDANITKILRKECRNWHPDMIHRLHQGSPLAVADQMMADMICRIVTELLNNSAGRSAECLD